MKRWADRGSGSRHVRTRRVPAGERDGWGGRDRTYECRNQNPVPYHLATPQRSKEQRGACMTARGSRMRGTRRDDSCECRQRMARKRPGDEAPRSPVAASVAAASAAALRHSDANHANTHPPDPVIRADGEHAAESRASAAAMSGNRATATGLQIIPAITLGKDFYFRRRRRRVSIPAQRRSRRSAPRPAGATTHAQRGGNDTAVRRFADAARERRRAEDEKRHVGAEREPDAHQRRARAVERATGG